MGFILIISGLVGAFLVGFWLDWTRRYKLVLTDGICSINYFWSKSSKMFLNCYYYYYIAEELPYSFMSAQFYLLQVLPWPYILSNSNCYFLFVESLGTVTKFFYNHYISLVFLYIESFIPLSISLDFLQPLFCLLDSNLRLKWRIRYRKACLLAY